MSHSPSPEVRLDFLYDLEKGEFILRFDNDNLATRYQAINPEARILRGQSGDVWLPRPSGTTSLRKSSRGMAVIFQSESEAQEWQRQTYLGATIDSNGVWGVYFKRDWSYAEMEKRIGFRRSNLRPLSPLPKKPISQSNSPKINENIKFDVEKQKISERADYLDVRWQIGTLIDK
ncbi:hypothetical protein V8C35DRAFT_302917 [Trichoderma chlorosporum]